MIVIQRLLVVTFNVAYLDKMQKTLYFQDHSNLDSSPGKEQMDESSLHRLDESLLTCEGDGNDIFFLFLTNFTNVEF